MLRSHGPSIQLGSAVVHIHFTVIPIQLLAILSLWLITNSLEYALYIGFLYFSLLVSTLFHELAHAVTANLLNQNVTHIILYPIAGLTQLDRQPHSASTTLLIYLAGPLFNLMIALILFPIIQFGSSLPLLADLMILNIGLALFNLLPLRPLDGHEILSHAWRIMKPESERTSLNTYMISGLLLILILLAPIQLSLSARLAAATLPLYSIWLNHVTDALQRDTLTKATARLIDLDIQHPTTLTSLESRTALAQIRAAWLRNEPIFLHDTSTSQLYLLDTHTLLTTGDVKLKLPPAIEHTQSLMAGLNAMNQANLDVILVMRHSQPLGYVTQSQIDRYQPDRNP